MFLKQNLTRKQIVIIVLIVLIILLSCNAIYLYFIGNRKLEKFTVTCPSKGFILNNAKYKYNNKDIDVTSKLSSLLSKNDTNTVKTIIAPQLFNYINTPFRNALTLDYCCDSKQLISTILDGCNLFSIGGINCNNFTTNYVNGMFVRIIGNPNNELNLCGVFIYNHIGNLIYYTSSTSKPIMKTALLNIDGTYNINPNTDVDSVKLPAENALKIVKLYENYSPRTVFDGNLPLGYSSTIINTFQTDDEYTAKSNGKSITQNKNKEFVDYWQFGLSSSINISAVEIYCRSNCCVNSSTNLKLQILNKAMNVVYEGSFPNQLGKDDKITDSQGQICYVSIPIPITTVQTTNPITTQKQTEITEPSVPTKYDCHVNDYLQDECNMSVAQNCTYFNSKCFNNNELESLSIIPIDNTYFGNFRGVISKDDNKYSLNIYNDKINSNTRILLKCISTTISCDTNLITNTNAFVSSGDLNLIEFYNNKLTQSLILDSIPTLSNNLIYITDLLSSKAYGINTILPSNQIGLLPQPPVDIILNSSNDLTQISAMQSLTKQGISVLQDSIVQ